MEWNGTERHGIPTRYGTDQGHESCVAYLLDVGADITATDEHDYTALHLAAYYGRVGVVALLLRYDMTSKTTKTICVEYHYGSWYGLIGLD